MSLKTEIKTYNFNTYNVITLYSNQELKINQQIIDLLNYYEQIFSFYDANSVLSNLNKFKEQKVDEHFLSLLQTSIEYAKKIPGGYHPMIGSLVKLWSINNQNNKPSQTQIDQSLKTIDLNNLIIKDKQISLKKGVDLDFSGVAKGYISDQLVKLFKDNQVTRALINLGGQLHCYNQNDNDSSFKVAIDSPRFEDQQNWLFQMQVSNMAIATSGVSQRYFQKEGIIYHHLLSPVTGYPVQNNLLSVIVITKSATKADLLSTSFLILGLEKSIQYIENDQDIEVIFITNNYQIYISNKNILDKYHIKFKNNDHQVIEYLKLIKKNCNKDQ